MLYHLTRFSLDHPRATLVILAVITLVLAGGLPRLRTEFGYRVLIGDDHPSIQAMDQFIERFGGGFPMHIAWECGDGHPCASIFDRDSLEMAAHVSQELASSPAIRTVRGPSNAAVLLPAPGGFAIRRLVENGDLPSDVEAIAERARTDSLWVGTLISSDARAAVIIVQPVDTEPATDIAALEAIQRAIAPFEERGFRFHLAGEAVASVIGGRDLADSTSRLIPFTVIVIGLILLLLTRAWQSALATLVTMGLALLWTFGALGWVGWPQDGILEVLAPLILIVGVCDAVHLLSAYSSEPECGDTGSYGTGHRSRLIRAVHEVGPACLITTLTTSGAFLSFVTSALDTFVRFGVISAFGVLACLALTFTLLPVLTTLLPQSGSRAMSQSVAWKRALASTIDASERRASSILIASGLLFSICAVGWGAYLRVDTDWYESFGEQSQVVRWIRFMEDHLGQSETLEVEIILQNTEPLEDPANLSRVSELSHFLANIEGLGQAESVLNLIASLNRILHDDDPRFEVPGDSRQANAELLELIGFDDPDLLRNWLSLDRRHIRISVEAHELSYSSRDQVLRTVEDYIARALPASWQVRLGGPMAMGFDWVRDVQGTQVRSFPTALAIVFVLVAFFLRSVRLALAAMVPTILSVVVTLGLMGWVGMSLDVGRAMLAAIILGIAVDDSIHVLSQYRNRREVGEDPRAAIRWAVLSTGRAVVTTSLALSFGFLTLMASAWQTISSFGFFVSLAVMGALAASLFVLPALIFAFTRPSR